MTVDSAADTDPESVLRADPVMALVVERRDPHQIDPNVDEFERLCVSIVNQQLSTASATAVRERMFEVLEGTVTPDTVLAADRDDLLGPASPGRKSTTSGTWLARSRNGI